MKKADDRTNITYYKRCATLDLTLGDWAAIRRDLGIPKSGVGRKIDLVDRNTGDAITVKITYQTVTKDMVYLNAERV